MSEVSPHEVVEHVLRQKQGLLVVENTLPHQRLTVQLRVDHPLEQGQVRPLLR